jgi:hypothetical protein
MWGNTDWNNYVIKCVQRLHILYAEQIVLLFQNVGRMITAFELCNLILNVKIL